MRKKTANNLKNANQEERRISRMINATLFFLHYAFILKESHGYRLVIVKNKEKVLDLEYRTLKDAKAACSKVVREKGTFKKRLIPRWSFFYPVDENWLEEKLNCS